MTTETQKITKKNKKERLKKRKLEKLVENDIEDEKLVIKKKKKIKDKKVKLAEIPNEEIQDDNNDQTTEENIEGKEENVEDAEVKKKEPSKRQVKKDKAELRAAFAKESSKQEAAQKALNYVSLWKNAKDQWKFNKVKQIWLIDNLLDEKYVPDAHYTTILEYFEGCKGFARQKLIDKAMNVVKKIEDSIEEDEELIETTEYKRARQLLQALPNET